jgi:hypothetical protein
MTVAELSHQQQQQQEQYRKAQLLAGMRARAAAHCMVLNPAQASPTASASSSNRSTPRSIAEPLTVDEIISASLTEEKLCKLAGTAALDSVSYLELQLDMCETIIEAGSEHYFTSFRDMGTRLEHLTALRGARCSEIT